MIGGECTITVALGKDIEERDSVGDRAEVGIKLWLLGAPKGSPARPEMSRELA